MAPGVSAVAVALALSACSNGGTGPSTMTSSPSTTPPIATPTALAGAVRTPVSTAIASEHGRADCPEAWLTASTGGTSVCYPAQHYAEFLRVPVDPRERLVVRLVPGPPVAFTPNTVSITLQEAYTPPNTCEFEAETVDATAETALGPYEIAGASGVACTARTSYATQFNGAVPVGSGGLEFRTYASTDEQLELAKRILQTVRAQ